MSAVATSETTQVYLPFVEADASADAAELQAQMEEIGYLFFRNLLPDEAILPVRRHILELCEEAGWLDPSRDLMEGIVAEGVVPCTEGHDAYHKVYRKVLKLPDFFALPEHPALMGIAEKILGGEAFVHPRRIGRMGFPNFQVATTPPHQDHFYIRGAVDTYSCWLPLGDAPIDIGCLAIGAGTHKRGFLNHSVHVPGAIGGMAVPLDDAEPEWHSSGFNQGDVVYFHSYTIHRALPNLTTNRLRLSTDNRYQRPTEKIEPDALLPHLKLD